MAGPIVDPHKRRTARALFHRFARDARGATAIEYALIAGLVFVAVVGSLRLYSSKVSGVYLTIGNAISQN